MINMTVPLPASNKLLITANLPHLGCNIIFVYADTVKGKAIPLQAWTGPQGSRRLTLPDFKTIGT
jgi:hypothetical protein